MEQEEEEREEEEEEEEEEVAPQCGPTLHPLRPRHHP